ncbi:MAG: helix-turn-helix domain-containing protein [Candidatus Kapaibacterium sp.]
MALNIYKNPEFLGENLRRLRQITGLTVESLAKAAGLSKSFVSYVERGLRSVSMPDLRRLTLACGWPLGRFITEASDYSANDAIIPAGGQAILSPAPLLMRLARPWRADLAEVIYISSTASGELDLSDLSARIDGFIISGSALMHNSAKVSAGDSFEISSGALEFECEHPAEILISIYPPEF